MNRRLKGNGWQELPRHGVLIVRHPKGPNGEPFQTADILIWEKVSARRVRMRDGIVYIQWSPRWWAHGELLHYAPSWEDSDRWVADAPDVLFAGQRVLMIPASSGS